MKIVILSIIAFVMLVITLMVRSILNEGSTLPDDELDEEDDEWDEFDLHR